MVENCLLTAHVARLQRSRLDGDPDLAPLEKFLIPSGTLVLDHHRTAIESVLMAKIHSGLAVVGDGVRGSSIWVPLRGMRRALAQKPRFTALNQQLALRREHLEICCCSSCSSLIFRSAPTRARPTSATIQKPGWSLSARATNGP